MSFGSSPQVRGKFIPPAATGRGTRLIPAGAGKIATAGTQRRLTAAHPRRCGENSRIELSYTPLYGSSPQVRGKSLLIWGFIPTKQVLELVWSPKPLLTLHDF